MLTVIKIVIIAATLAMGGAAASAFLTGQALLGAGWLLLAMIAVLIFAQLG
jgi:hypothetical protein